MVVGCVCAPVVLEAMLLGAKAPGRVSQGKLVSGEGPYLQAERCGVGILPKELLLSDQSHIDH